MAVVQRKLSKSFKAFFDSEKSSGILLLICTFASLALANSILGANYLGVWQTYVGGLSVEHWINDGLMAIFFLLIGLELERELYNGELSNFSNALLPIFAALGGLVLPALMHFSLNAGTASQAGSGIPGRDRHRFRFGRSRASRRSSSGVSKGFSDRACCDGRLGGDYHHRHLLHGAALARISDRRARRVRYARRAEPLLPSDVAHPVPARRRVDVVSDVEIGRSRDDRRSVAGVRDSVLR